MANIQSGLPKMALRAAIVGALALSAGFTTAAQAAPYGPYALTNGQAAVAAALDSSIPAAGSDRAAMLASIDALPSVGERADALGQLTARSYTLLPRLSIQSMDAADREIRHYLTERRSIALDAAGGVPDSGDGTIHMMLTGGLRQAKYDGRTDRPEARTDSRSIRFAIDVSPVPNLIIGATLGIDGVDARLDPDQRPRITSFNSQIGAYASYQNGKFYVDATANYNFSEFKLRRQATWNGFSDRMTASADGDGVGASVEAGAMLKSGAVRVQPFAGLHYRHADIGGFREGGGAAALEVANYRTRSLRSTLGARASATIEKGDWAIRPTVEAQWRRELRAQPDSRIEARFATRDLPVFSLRPAGLARDEALLSAAVTATHNSRTAVRLGYSGDYAADHRVHAAILSISRRF
ncbi:autotransporter domain-containing protein [Sphingobium sp. ZW T5_29]|uniref:autotransporter outer membrane beta-barrel domain-containing protein n=1 Tax=Sphingobium sp. ZW T5_29 TaxID=3378077 RepID=UPI003854934C